MEKTQIEELYSLPWEDKSCADPIEKARRVLGQIANRDSGYFYNDGYPRSVTIKKEVENVLKVLNTLAAAAPSDHTDDLAVDRFAAAMKAKMAASRAKGRNGWDNAHLCPVERLQGMLIDHLAKGDPVDIGNFAMMLFNRNAPVAAPAQAEPSECDWRQEDDENMPQTYRTRCGQLWSFIEGGPADNSVKFCHCCGKPVKEVAAA